MTKEKDKKLKKEIVKEIIIPEGIEVIIKDNMITMKKDSNELKRKVDPRISIKKEDNKVILKITEIKRPTKRNLGTLAGHIKNMAEGLTNGFEYELEICNVHFPMSVEFDKANKVILIKNMLGEKYPRKLKINEKAELVIAPPKITIRSFDIELAGRTASNIEIISRVRNRDRNKFQDGIFITKKPRKNFL